MINPLRLNVRASEVFRFYQAGLLNLAFGIAAYMALVWLGFGKYPSQLISHLAGMIFNYFTYSGYVFRGTSPAKMRFVISYLLNYLVGLSVLFFISKFVSNDYYSGLITALLVSVVNYFGLRHLVFRSADA